MEKILYPEEPVLIVDDELKTLEGFSFILKMAGICVNFISASQAAGYLRSASGPHMKTGKTWAEIATNMPPEVKDEKYYSFNR